MEEDSAKAEVSADLGDELGIVLVVVDGVPMQVQFLSQVE
jgi:hypothetical protein